MKDQFVTYLLAQKLASINCNLACFGSYTDEENFNFTTGGLMYNVWPKRNYVAAPLWQQAISFLKENKVLVTELWDGWEVARENEDFEWYKTKEQAIYAGIELITPKQ